jgi:hypothetical protein
MNRRARALLPSGLVFAFLLSASTSVGAQQAVTPNSYTDLSSYLLQGNQPVPQQALASPSLSSTVTQIGQMNTATATLAGSGNITNQYQSGSQNSSTLSANGTQNTLNTTQIGNSNTSAISVVGNNNNISNLQVGSGLTYQLQVIGTSAPVSVQQFGRR